MIHLCVLYTFYMILTISSALLSWAIMAKFIFGQVMQKCWEYIKPASAPMYLLILSILIYSDWWGSINSIFRVNDLDSLSLLVTLICKMPLCANILVLRDLLAHLRTATGGKLLGTVRGEGPAPYVTMGTAPCVARDQHRAWWGTSTYVTRDQHRAWQETSTCVARE